MEILGNDLTFIGTREYERTKHVHRLHPYLGKFIPQLVEVFLKKYFQRGDTILDPFSGSGTTLIEANALGKNEENYFDITSAKPNMKEFVALKLKLLRWTGLRLSQDKGIKVFTRLAIPYNPYHPEPYERWTLKGLYDLKNNEILVGKEFWNFVASDNIYEELLDVFQEVGEELREGIDKKFAEFRRE